MRWVSRIALTLAVAAAVALALSGPGTRFGLWPYQVGLLLYAAAGIAGLATGVLSIVGLCIPKIRQGRLGVLLAALVLGAASAAAPLGFLLKARSVPPINDISTDLANPAFAEQQRKAYPDVQPLTLATSPQSSFERALAAARAMGWEIVREDAASGRIEAVDTSGWFGFKDDVQVRITAATQGSRVDVRSRSRVGRSDIGANAKRIRSYFERLK